MVLIFLCGEFGHLKSTCPRNKVVSNKYPLKEPVEYFSSNIVVVAVVVVVVLLWLWIAL